MKIVLHFYFLLFLCTAAASQTQITPKIAAVPNAQIHILPEQYPEFKGGEKALIEFVQKNLVYSTTHADTTFSGKTIIRFVVMEDGKVDSVTVKRSCGRKKFGCGGHTGNKYFTRFYTRQNKWQTCCMPLSSTSNI
jgi:hypothetical protein